MLVAGVGRGGNNVSEEHQVPFLSGAGEPVEGVERHPDQSERETRETVKCVCV